MIDLLSASVGGRVVGSNDEFFAEAFNLLSEGDPVWREGEYTDRGKWMDGWETRRRREPGHDWCVVALGIPGRIGQVTLDTSFFTGNYPERFSLEACGVADDDDIPGATWVELIPSTPLEGDNIAVFDVADTHRATYLRLNIYPDGGVARIRALGEPIAAPDQVCTGGPLDLVSMVVGGVALDASDTHYSQPSNLLRPNPSCGMWDGWETKRRRGPGNDWATFRLGLPGAVEKVVVDTTHFKGNSPGWVTVELSEDGEGWAKVAEMSPVVAHTVNEIAFAPSHAGYLRISTYPDGGVARLRVLGRADADYAGDLIVAYVNSSFDAESVAFFETACASRRWAVAMTSARPFAGVDELLEVAAKTFDDLVEGDWLEAFAGHPRIGERGDLVSAREQAGVAGASDTVRSDLASVNRAYEERFGFTCIVYATGKGATEMLDIAKTRLGNERAEEIRIAAAEQRKITDTRLRRMTCQDRP